MRKLRRRESRGLRLPHAAAIGGLGLLILGPVLLVGLGAFGIVRWALSQRTIKRWRRAAQRHGLKTEAWNHFVDYGIEATDGETTIRASSHLLVGPFSRDRFRVEVRSRVLPQRVRAAPASPHEAIHGLSTGDQYFDERIIVAGDEAEALAHFSSRGRHALLRVAGRYGATLDAGALEHHARSTDTSEHGFFQLTGELMWSIRDLGLGGRSCAASLALNGASDPVPAVRFNSLRQLFQRYPTDPEVREAALRGCRDTDPAVRVEAGSFLGVEGLDTLIGVVGEPGVASALRRQALSLVGRLGDAMAIGRGVTEALRSTDALLVCAAAALAAERRLSGLVPALETAIRRSEPLAASACVEALGRLGDPRAQSILIELLGQRDPRVRMAAIRALGAVGGPLALEPLSRYTEGLLLGRDVKEAARQSIEAIRTRGLPAGAGRLSVAGPGDEAGRLSWATAGELELADS